MKTIVKVSYVVAAACLLYYLTYPNPKFPAPPPNSVRSFEPADVETPFRRAYYTNLDRTEVLIYYQSAFSHKLWPGILIYSYRLNYPPEEAQTLIRDQTRSTFLEEIVHPFRNSLFVNGFEPIEDKDKIVIDGVVWRQKIIVRYFPVAESYRLLIGALVIALTPVVVTGFWRSFNNFAKSVY